MKRNYLMLSLLVAFSIMLLGCVAPESVEKVISPEEKAERVETFRERFAQVQLEASLKDDFLDILQGLYIATETKRITDPTKVELYEGSILQPCKAIYISSENRLSETELEVTSLYAQKWNWPLCRNLKLNANPKTDTAKPKKIWLFTNAKKTKYWYFKINDREILLHPENPVTYDRAKIIIEAIAKREMIDSAKEPTKSHKKLISYLTSNFDQLESFVLTIDALLGSTEEAIGHTLLYPHVIAVIDVIDLEVHLRGIQYRDH